MVTPSHLSQLRDARTHLTRACGACAAVRSASVYLAQLLDAYVPPSLLEPWMADSVIEAAPALTVAVECGVGLLMIVAAYARAPRCRACGLLLATALHVGIDLTPPPNRHASAHTCLHICRVASSQAFATRPLAATPSSPPTHPRTSQYRHVQPQGGHSLLLVRSPRRDAGARRGKPPPRHSQVYPRT